MHPDDIIRDGFRYAHGRFFAQHRVERVDGSRLSSIFLPRLTPEASKLIQTYSRSDFVRGQLQHYGVGYDESDFSGNGTLLLKKALQAGKCDKVPDHIEALRVEMYAEWLERQSEEQLSDNPKWVMDKHFVDSSGKPYPTKTTKVIGIPYPPLSNYRSSQLRDAAGRISGLHQATARGCSTQTVYLSWDRDAVEQAAKHHAAREAQASQARADAREAERAARHEKYLADAKKPESGPRGPSPIGQYMVDCEEIEGGWPDLADDMTLDIGITSEPGIYQASFDFGVIQGVMYLSADEGDLDAFCAEQEELYYDDDEENGYDTDSSEDEDNEEEEPVTPASGSKRKAAAGKQPATKKAKTAGNPRTFFLRLKCSETGEGEIFSTPEKGTIKFDSSKLSSFTGRADMPCVGQGVVFTARKISAVPPTLGDSWEAYSEAAYERARVGRWR